MIYTHTDTDHNKENEYPKLVRDNIPDIIQKDRGVVVETEVVTDDDTFTQMLLKKVLEEAEELSLSKSDENIQEEIVDVYEVIDTLCALKGWSKDTIEHLQKAKRSDRGGFEKRLIMLEKPV